jgi:nitroreductase
MDLQQALHWRYAVKVFQSDRKIPNDILNTLESTLYLSPSSFGLQPWLFMVIQNQALKEQLRAQSWNQGQVTDCSHFVVFAALEKVTEDYIDSHLKRMSDVRGVTLESLAGFRKSMLGFLVNSPKSTQSLEWSTRQCYIALGGFMTAAAVLGIDTCPMEGLNPAEYDNILGLPALGYRTAVACAAGYRSENDPLLAQTKVRFSPDQVVKRIP